MPEACSRLLPPRRAAPFSIIRNDFGSETVFGRTTSGLYDATDTYVVNLLLCEARLAPEQVTAVPGTTGNFFDVLSAQFPTGAGWNDAAP